MEVGGCSTSRPLSFSVTQSKSKSKSKSKRTMLHFWCPKPIPSVPHMALGNNHHQHTPLRMSSGSRSDTTDVVEVVWSVEADLGDGQLLYLTGDPVALGCWDPDMALLMFPTQHLHLWNLQLKVPCGIHFKYSYFIKHPNSNLLVWRPGPQSSLLIPPSLQNQNAIHVRDMWTTLPIHTLPPHHFWGSWFDIHTPPSFITDQHALSTINNNLSMHQNSHGMDDTLSFTKTKGLDSSETDQPVEEPWLPLSLLKPNQNLVSDHYQLTPKESPPTSYHAKGDIEDQSCLSHLKDPISTIILISSSVCTMQRIAILEDEKLVELLLEPVKNNVQCDNVYLGVITKLIPNMGGAFVNIGISRPSLMQIKHYREPFVFPPFRRKSKQKDVKPSAITDHKGHPDTTGNKLSLHNGVDVADGFEEVLFQCDSEQFANEDFEDHDVEYDFDSPTAPETNMNGHYLGSTVDDKFFSAETGGFRDSQLLHNVLQDMKDSESVQSKENKWDYVQKGTKVIVQVVKEGLGTKGPTLTAYPHLRSRFWILSTRCKRIGVSKKISGVERTRLRVIAKTLQPPGFGLTVRTVSAGHTLEELQKDLEGLLSAWKSIMEHAKSAALAADEGVEGAIPVILHRAMGQTLSVAQDYFNEKVKGMIVDSPRTYHEITSYLQEIAPDLCHRVKLYSKKTPIFDEYGIEEEINNMLNKRVPLANGGSLVIEQTEALVSIDVNGGHGMLGGQGNSQEKAVLEVNLAAAKQIARELRLRDIGGIIVVDFIDMVDESNKKLVYKEVKRAVEKDRSKVKVSELSRHGLMEITRKRVRPSVTFMISEPCPYCHATGRVEALETSFSKIELEICRLQAMLEQKQDAGNPKSWPKFVLRVDQYMCNYLTSGKRTRLALLSSSLKVWILLKVARGFSRGAFEVKPFIDEMENSKHNQVSISRLRPREGKSYIPSTKLALFPVKKWQTGPK